MMGPRINSFFFQRKIFIYFDICYLHSLMVFCMFSSYDKGAYLFLPSYIMRIHGAKQQREVLKGTPKENLQPVFDVSIDPFLIFIFSFYSFFNCSVFLNSSHDYRLCGFCGS